MVHFVHFPRPGNIILIYTCMIHTGNVWNFCKPNILGEEPFSLLWSPLAKNGPFWSRQWPTMAGLSSFQPKGSQNGPNWSTKLSLIILSIRLCLCIYVPCSFLNSFHHKLSEYVWVWGSGASRSWDVTIAGRTNKRTNKEN